MWLLTTASEVRILSGEREGLYVDLRALGNVPEDEP